MLLIQLNQQTKLCILKYVKRDTVIIIGSTVAICYIRQKILKVSLVNRASMVQVKEFRREVL